MNHSLNLTHDGTLIVRVPKGYKVEKVKVETFEGEEIPTHITPSNTLGTLDCISRQAVKEWLKRWDGYLDQDMIARMQYGVSHIPSVQPTPFQDWEKIILSNLFVRKGKWIDEGLYAECHSKHEFRCSECGGHIIEIRPDDFCKHCGADMRGEQDGNK